MTTIYDVARAARVTAATVSNVLTGKGAVGPETRRKVEAAIAELGYQPNLLARSLATRQTLTLALILPNIANPFYPEIALEVEETARRHGYSLFLCNTGNDEAIGHTYLQQLVSRRVDGLIVMPGGLSLEDLAAVSQQGLPVVLCNWEERDELPALPMVGVDFARAGALAAEHLLSLGHRRIGLIADASVPHTRHTERVAGFVATLAAAGVSWEPDLLRIGDSSIDSGFSAARALCSLPDPPTAIFGTNDLMAVGALEGAIDSGRRVPEDLSIVGHDDITIVAYTHPPLTTIAIPKRLVAAEATAILLQWVTGGPTPATEPVQITPSLIVRNSTRAVAPPLQPVGAVVGDARAGAASVPDTYRYLLDAAQPPR